LIDASRQRKHSPNISADPVNANYSILLCKGPIKPLYIYIYIYIYIYDECACIDGETTV
jgi:hypothetical protein